MTIEQKIYTPSPTGQRFIDSDAMVRLILGPVGGGKTTDMAMESYKLSCFSPVCRDGVIRSRGAIVRTTYQ